MLCSCNSDSVLAGLKQFAIYHSFCPFVKSEMAIKFVFVVFCLLLLQSSEAVKLLARQESPPLNRDCSAQEEQELLDAFTPDCRDAFDAALDFTNVLTILGTLNDPSNFVALCSNSCLPSLLEYTEECYGTTDGLVELISRGVCLFNINGTMCYTAIFNSLVDFDNSWQARVRNECFVNFPFPQKPLADMNTEQFPICSDSCREGLRQFNDEFGCCVNSIYNNTFVGEHLPFAGNELWTRCGIISESPGFCSSAVVASALSTGIYSLIVIITLGTMFL